jgi:hypothetical protein
MEWMGVQAMTDPIRVADEDEVLALIEEVNRLEQRLQELENQERELREGWARCLYEWNMSEGTDPAYTMEDALSDVDDALHTTPSEGENTDGA